MSDIELPAPVRQETDEDELMSECPPSLPSDQPDLPSDVSCDLPSDVSECQEHACAESGDLPPDVEAECDDVPSPRVALAGLQELQVPSPHDVREWLSSGKISCGRWGVELYSPPRVLAKTILPLAILTIGFLSFDILNGWNFDNEDVVQISLDILRLQTVYFCYMSPPCTMFSELQRLWNYKRLGTEKWKIRWGIAVSYIDHCMAAALIQIEKRQFFMFEHPHRASSWKLPSVNRILGLTGVFCVSFDMCSFGMCSPLGEPIRKRTKIMTNHAGLAAALQGHQCSRDHTHKHIEGSQLGHSLSRWCQIYPPDLVSLLANFLQEP